VTFSGEFSVGCGAPVSGELRKRAHSYLNVTDVRLSFQAAGTLAYLLEKPARWGVRSLAIAADSPDGKAAVQARLRELAGRATTGSNTADCWTAAW
jgi:hypothetical protein